MFLEGLDRDLGRSGVEVLAAALGDGPLVAYDNECVGKCIRAAVVEVVVRESQPAEVVHVVRRVEVPGERCSRAVAWFRELVGEHDLLLDDQERLGAEYLACAPRMLDGHKERVRAERLLGREPEHRRAQGRKDSRDRRSRHPCAVRADERVVVHRVEIGAHR